MPAKDISAWVDVGGRASAPELSLRSTPSMPEDEILARAFFGKRTSELGPLEAVRLAQAVAELTGTGRWWRRVRSDRVCPPASGH